MGIGNKKAVFFDAADTLFYVKEGVGRTYYEVARSYCPDTTPKEIRAAFGKAFHSAPPLVFPGVNGEQRKSLEKRWWYDVVKNVFNDVGMFEEFDEYFEKLFEVFRTDAWVLFPETTAVLEELKDRGIKLGVISNFDSRVYDVCDRLDITKYFDSFVISSESGYAKPSPEIFKLALRKLSLAPEESIHIGDSMELDYMGAGSSGIKPLLLDREGKYDGREDVSRIYSLSEVMKLINAG
ncbi:MAG: HAD-IA family hydrolase [Thermodesulfobacteriota bacterium]